MRLKLAKTGPVVDNRIGLVTGYWTTTASLAADIYHTPYRRLSIKNNYPPKEPRT
jgi:hypothetical protein